MPATKTTSPSDLTVTALKWAFWKGDLSKCEPPVAKTDVLRGFRKMTSSLETASPNTMDGWVSKVHSLRVTHELPSSAQINVWQGLEPRGSEMANRLGIVYQLLNHVESHPPSQVTLEDGTVYTIREPTYPSDESLAMLTAEGQADFKRNFEKRGWQPPTETA